MTALSEHLLNLESRFSEALDQHRFWHIFPHEGNEPVGIYDAETGLRYPGPQALRTFLDTHPFLNLKDHKGTFSQITLHTQTRLLWFVGMSVLNGNSYAPAQAETLCNDADWGGFSGWKLPTKDNLRAFCTADGNPYRRGEKYRLQYGNGEAYLWLSTSGPVCVAEGNWGVLEAYLRLSTSGPVCVAEGNWGVSSGDGALIPVNHSWASLDDTALLCTLVQAGWHLVTPDGKACWPPKPDTSWQNLSLGALIHKLTRRGEHLVTADGKIDWSFPHAAFPVLGEIDYRPSRLPKLELTQITDPHKGLWELWGMPAETLRNWKLIARNPAVDVKSHPVAIDFGTSSTVVAVQEGTRAVLLRVGARDYYAPITPGEFENPTVIELINFDAFMNEWQTTAYRPNHDWNWLRMGHEAQASWRDNPGDTTVLGAILPRLKTWAVRAEALPPLHLTDREHNREIEIPPLDERTPVRGQPLSVGTRDPFDPIEFYAFQLGMAINWRGRGLHLEYYLSFPAKYDNATKSKIRASFARGLQRSLPPTLITQGGDWLQRFRVEELASEPAAYAAAALSYLGVAPDEEGIAYAVFDFGGGTTDFDFGLWRTASPEEEDEGFEAVFEHLESSGDNYLGGEQLLEHLAYQTFCANLDVLREKRIHFTRPEDAEVRPGSESFLQPTQAAQTNTVMLISKLRPFWEGEEASLADAIKIDLIDANGEKQTVELVTRPDELEEFLNTRISRGVTLFMEELARTFGDSGNWRETVHILLAGNASRSRHVRRAFAQDGEAWQQVIEEVFGEDEAPEIRVHDPLPVDMENPYAPTAKTGVALGLLKLVPGNGLKVINRVRSRHQDETSFLFFFGRIRRGLFEFTLSPASAYSEWVEIGPVSAGYFNAFATRSPRARKSMSKDDPELKLYRLHFPEAGAGDRLWARAISPREVEVCCVHRGEIPQPDSSGQHLTLDDA